MLRHTPSAHPRWLWIALSVLAVLAMVGLIVMIVRSDGQVAGIGPTAPIRSSSAEDSASATSLANTESTRPLPGVAPTTRAWSAA